MEFNLDMEYVVSKSVVIEAQTLEEAFEIAANMDYPVMDDLEFVKLDYIVDCETGHTLYL